MKLYPIKVDDRYGAVDENGNVRIQCRFEALGEFEEGLAPFSRSGKDGYIDLSGNVVIEPQYDLAGTFRAGFAIVETGGNQGFINTKNIAIIPQRLVKARDFECGLALVQETITSPYGYIDETGKYAIEPQFVSAHSFSEGLAAVLNDDLKTGYIGKDGEFQIEPRFTLGYGFSEGLAAVSVTKPGRKLGFVNNRGEMVLPPRWSGANVRFSEGLAAVWSESGFGFIDSSGKLAIRHSFENAEHFSKGLCAVAVKIRGRLRYGFIDKAGDFAIPPDFDIAWTFDKFGVAAIRLEDESFGYINTSGDYVWEPTK